MASASSSPGGWGSSATIARIRVTVHRSFWSALRRRTTAFGCAVTTADTIRERTGVRLLVVGMRGLLRVGCGQPREAWLVLLAVKPKTAPPCGRYDESAVLRLDSPCDCATAGTCPHPTTTGAAA